MAISHNSPDQELRSSASLSSTHPAEGAAKSRTWLWILILVILAGSGYYYFKTRGSAESKAAPAPGATRGAGMGAVSVAVVPALKQDVPYYLSGLGSVTPFNTVTVKSRVDGELQKVYFQEGQFVKEGDLLAEIDPRPFQVALEQMEGQLSRDQAQLNNARVDLKRYTELSKEGVIATQQADTQNAMVGQLEGAIRADQAQIDNEKLQLVYCRITAPLSGRVGLRLVDQGNMIRATDPNGLVVITQVQPMATLFTLPEDNLPEVIQHMKNGQLSVEAFSRDDATKLATGKLLTIDNQIDPTTGTVRLKAEFPNSDLSLWPNQFVNIRLMLEVRRDAIVVPLAAIQRGTQGSYVYTVSNGHANMQPVKVSLTQGNICLIASGISAGDQVVVDGQDRLQSGSAVEAHSGSPNGGGPQGGSQADQAGQGGAKGQGKSGAPAGGAPNGGPKGQSKEGRQGKQS
jgi:multidrug efflux system membrane fusion protein